MQEATAIEVPGAVETTEKKENLRKIWNTLVDIEKTTQKIKLKLAPLGLRITAIFAPEAAPVLVPLSKLLKDQKIQEIGEKNQDVLAELLKGNRDEALEMAKEAYNLSGEDENSLVSNIEETYEEIKRGMRK